MAKVTFRFPSKMIQYGYAEVEFDTSTPVPQVLGKMYAKETLAFQAAEIDAFEAAKQASQDHFVSELGAKVVEVIEHASPPSGADREEMEAAADQLTPGERDAIPAPPWEQAVKPVSKPWEGPVPSFNFGN